MTDTTPTPSLAPAPGPEADLSGRQIGDYRILRRIGRGAMAEVYLAEQSSLQRQVALKVLRQHLANDRSYILRFGNEARAAAALVHANIVQIYEVGQLEDLHFIAQEYVAGQNLRQLLDRHGPLSASLAVTIMRQVAAALHKAAGKGIVHRDIKPENIMLSAAGEVKVADFGLSRVAGGDAVELTQVGITMGTPLYMSPEQAEGDKLDSRSDLYSFGVTAYHVLAGRPPFEGDTPLAVAVQHVRSQPARLESLRPDLPTGLCRIVHKLLEKSPDDRYQDATALLKDLRALPIDGDDGQWTEMIEEWNTPELIALADARVEATQQLDALMKSAARRRKTGGARWLAAILAGVVLAFLGGAALAWMNREPNLLDPAGPPIVEELADGEAQYWHAMAQENQDDREAAFRAVLQYHPQDTYHANLARQQLARIYLADKRYEAALRMFNELAGLDTTQESLRAFGLAGQIICYDRTNRNREAAEKIVELKPLEERLDKEMKSEVDKIKQRAASS